MSLQYRIATAEDFERLLALRIAAIQPSLERIGRFEPQRARERFCAAFEPAFMRLVLEGDDLVGCVTVKPGEGGALWVEHLYIEPAHQGRGLGAQIVATIIAQADAEQRVIRLGVLRESDANRFYARLGFTETHREEWDIYYERAPPRRAE